MITARPLGGARNVYGLVNKALQEMVERDHGEAVWEQVLATAGVDTPVFVSLDAYPDEWTYQLVGAVAGVTHRDPTDLLHDFGRHWVLDTAARNYGHLLQAGGRTFRDFLLALPNFHARVSLMMPKLVPPEFDCEERGPRSLLLHYRSQRAGLVPFVGGLIDGLAELFNVTVTVRIDAQRSEGAGHTAFLIDWVDGGPHA